MIKFKFLFTLLFVCAFGYSNAQQDKLLTHWMYDKMSINPGETGIDPGVCATTLYRNQWDKVSGAPNSALLNIEANLDGILPIPGGLGISFYHDAIGFVRQNNLTLNYSFPVYTDYGTLGVGAGLGLINIGMQPDWVPPTQVFDISLPTGFAKSGFDMNFGLYWKGNENYYVGLSSTHLNAARLSETFNVGQISGTQTYNTARHYYIMGGYQYALGTSGAKLDGNVLMRTDLVKFSSDINVRYMNEIRSSGLQYYGGLTFRTTDAIAAMIGGSYNNWTAGYSYDYTINKLSSISNGTHELFVKYCYFIPPPPKTPSKHPRWL